MYNIEDVPLHIYSTGDADLRVRVYDTDGVFVGGSDDEGSGANFDLQVAGSGEYWIEVFAFEAAEGATLHVELPEPAFDPLSLWDIWMDLGLITTETSFEQLLSDSTPRMVYGFETNGPMTVRSTTLGTPLDTVGTLYDANGNQIAYNDDAPDNIEVENHFRLEVPAAGVYYIEVEGFFGAQGDFMLQFTPNP